MRFASSNRKPEYGHENGLYSGFFYAQGSSNRRYSLIKWQ